MTTAEIEEFEAAADGNGPKLDVSALPRPDIQNGFYTLTFPCGSHRVFRISTRQRGAFAGKRILGMLIGPDNTSDYEDFAFLGPEGFQVWKRFKGAKQAEYATKLFALITGGEIDEHTLTVSRRCMVCNRTLTTPESYAKGIGPVCESR